MARGPDYFDNLQRTRLDPTVALLVGQRLYLIKKGTTAEVEFQGVFDHNYETLDRYVGAEIAYTPGMASVQFIPIQRSLTGVNIEQDDTIRNPHSGNFYSVIMEPMWKDEETEMIVPLELKAQL